MKIITVKLCDITTKHPKMINKYYFENDISDEEKTYIKSIVKCNTTKRVGLYFTKSIKNVNDYVKSKYNNAWLSGCDVKLFISIQHMEGVATCISSVINFLLEQEIKKHCSIVISKFTENNYKMVIYEQIGNVYNEGTEIKYSYSTVYNFLSHDPRLINFVEIVNNNVTAFNCQYVECGKIIDKLDHRNNEKKVIGLKDDCELTFEINKEYCNLIDQYNDFTNFQRETINKKPILDLPQNLIDCPLPIELIRNKTITIIDKENKYDIEFTNYDNLNQINRYLKKEFGEGILSYKVNLKDNKTTVVYMLN